MFEHTLPYLFHCPTTDDRVQDYDIGGVRLVRAIQGNPPPPTDGECENQFAEKTDVVWPAKLHDFLDQTFGRHEALLVGQVHWLCHIPPWECEFVADLYETIWKHGKHSAMIPIDFRNYVKD